ncbi:unnamed protein product [Ectocarpus sp. 13 AM-2016]
MKFTTALVGAGALCASTDAFVPAAVPASSSTFVSKRSVVAAAAPAILASRGGDVMMSLGGGGSKKGGLPQSVSSKITNIFRGGSRKGNSNSGGVNGGGGNGKVPPLGASSSAEGDGEKKAKGLGVIWAAYMSLLASQPLLTKSLTSMTGFALGDLLAQKFIDKKEELDLPRLLKLASFGALIHGSSGHFFYNFLDSKIPGTAALTVAKKVFIDQVLWNPIFGCMFFGYMGAVDGMGPSGISEKIKNNLWTSVKGSWTVWPVAHAINFRLIPTSQRLLYINTIQIFYNCFLSVIAQRE